MLTVGITLMVASVVVGIITLTSAALMSSAARSGGRRARTTVALPDRKQDPAYHDLFGETEQGAHRDATEQGAHPHTEEYEQPPRWVLALAMISGAGLVLGLLLVMIPSIL